MALRKSLLPLLFLVLLLGGCAAFGPSGKQRTSALDDFMYALRWQRFPEASTYFTREHRGAFLDRMDGIKDLNITDVRLKRADIKDEGRRAEVVLEMDYYILPSATLRTLRIPQTWVYYETGDSDHDGFMITTAFPEFP